NPAAIYGPDDEIPYPEGTEKLDYELEVAAVIGAGGAIGGFTVMNDWSARDLQRREMAIGLGPAKGKDFATSLGPVVVTPDELGAQAARARAGRLRTVSSRPRPRLQPRPLADLPACVRRGRVRAPRPGSARAVARARGRDRRDAARALRSGRDRAHARGEHGAHARALRRRLGAARPRGGRAALPDPRSGGVVRGRAAGGGHRPPRQGAARLCARAGAAREHARAP